MTLKEILTLKNVSRSKVAEALNINKVNIGRYDNLEKRSLVDIQTIADVIGITLSEMIGLIYEEASYENEEVELNSSILGEPQAETYVKKNSNNITPLKKASIDDKEVILKNLSEAIRISVESEKIANNNIQQLIQLINDRK